MGMSTKGFTLVEVLVSLLIISIALAGAYAVMMHTVATGNLVQQNFVANGLAQEGMEVVRNLRDTDWFTGKPFGSFGGAMLANGTYCVQWDSTALIDLCTNPLKRSEEGLWVHDVGTDTVFSRTVTITPITPQEVQVVVDVAWPGRSGVQHLTAEGHLFDWF